MIRNFTLCLALGLCSTLFCKFANAITYVDNGTSTNYSLNSGDTLYIASGTYTGTVSGLTSNNRTIIVAGGATFQPTLLDGTSNGIVCKMHIYGTFTYSSSLTTNTTFTLTNYAGGVVNLAALNTKGKDQVWTNNIGGTINFSGNVLLNGGTASDDNNVFTNYETINANGNFQMNSGSFFYNYKDFNVAGNYKANGGTLRNEGNFVVTGLLEINSGATPIENYCRMQALGGIDISNATFFNYSYVWAKNSEIKITGGGITNINIPGASPPMLHGASFNQTGGAVTGPALMYFYGATSITSGGTIGITGTTTDTIKMYDITKTSSSTIFDVQAANTVRPNVIYNAWGAPDSNRVYLFGCSVEIFLEIPLAINWNSFVVDLFDNVPVLNWSAEFDRPTNFEIQRSYDGRNFSPIGQVSSIEGRTGYSYNDKSVNGQPGVVYYRIKGVELGGEVKYSQTRLIKFSQKPGSIYTAPNPFTNNFIINYRSAAKETITIRMFDVSGQQMLAKNVTVIAGDNAINIYEASQIAKGIYVIQISKGSYMISSGKIIKQ